MDMPFIVQRKLRVIKGQHTQEIMLGFSAPYSPPTTLTGEAGYACRVLSCDDPSLAYEVCAPDAFEALEVALLHVRKFLAELVTSDVDRVEWENGSLVEPSGSEFIKQFRMHH